MAEVAEREAEIKVLIQTIENRDEELDELAENLFDCRVACSLLMFAIQNSENPKPIMEGLRKAAKHVDMLEYFQKLGFLGDDETEKES